MKNFSALILFVFIAAVSFGQTNVVLQSQKTNAAIISDSQSGITFKNSLEGFEISTVKTKDGNYSRIIVPSYYPDMQIGCPELPVMTKLIEVPLDAEFEINIISYDEQIVDLNEYGFNLSLVPNQPSLFKNQSIDEVPFEKNNSIYRDKEFYNTQPVDVQLISKMRGIQVAQITVNPFSYDIESNTLTIKNNIVAEITYKNVDLQKSAQLKADKYSPAFISSYKSMWNYKAPATKDAISQYPINYVIISDRMFEEALEPFIDWKTKKGFYVTVAYTDVIGNTTTAIKAYIQSLYDAGTAESPAPTYVLLVGDVAQIPAFSASGHYTDMYYCEFDGGGDYVPEIYFGRFSATNVVQLQPQIDKTLMFEEYTFPDPSFLAEVVLVAGDDATFGPTHANGQINYAHNYYFNSDHGVTTDHTYLYPAAGSSAAAIISDISNGVGFVNYTAHCGVTGWAGPSFTTTNIPSLTNNDEYFFSIGNCCQSNTFYENECFGEALLRADKKGAVVHIGGSNNTLWNEDFYWSCGVASSISATTSYEQTSQAAYDHMFHENGEDPYVSAYAITYAGNMQVMESTSSQDKYYWEIYHVMGDPSLMPYVGVPPQIEANYQENIYVGMSSLIVNTEPGAYVAISLNGVLLDAVIADNSGIAMLEFSPLSTEGQADIVITKQFRAPFIENIEIIPSDNQIDAMLFSINYPNEPLSINESEIVPSITIMNLGQNNLTSADITLVVNGENPHTINWNGNLEYLQTQIVSFPSTTLPAGLDTITASVTNPNGLVDEYPGNDVSARTVLVYSGNVKIISAQTPVEIYCNTNMVTPSFTIKNFDSYPLTSAVFTFNLPGNSQELEWTGNLAYNETAQVSFPECWISEGEHTMTYEIESVNGGDNIATSGTTFNVDFEIIPTGNLIVLDILTDNYPGETTWKIKDAVSLEILYEGGPYSVNNSHNITNLCFEDGCYTFTVYDSYGDGMGGTSSNTADGHITITNTNSSELILDFNAGANYWSQYSVDFCVVNSKKEDISNDINILKLFPNPSTGFINLEFGDIIESVSVYNNLGQLLINQDINDYSTTLNIQTLPQGIYLVKVNSAEQTILKKVILDK